MASNVRLQSISFRQNGLAAHAPTQDIGVRDKVDSSALSAIQSLRQTPRYKSVDYMYFAGDVSGVPRLTAGLVYTIHGANTPPGLQGLGMTSALSVLTGYLNGEQRYKDFVEAEKIKDTKGKWLGILRGYRAPLDILGGLTFTPFRALSLAGAYTSAKAVSVAATVLGNIGAGFFSLSYLLIMIPSFITLSQNFGFHRKLEEAMEGGETEAEKYQAGLQLMTDSLEGTEKDWKKAMQMLFKDTSIVEDKVVKKEVEIDPEELKLLTPEELAYIESEISREGFNLENHPKMIEQGKQAFIAMKKRLDAKMTRKTGPKAVALLRHAGPLLDALKRGEGAREAKEMFDAIDKEKTKTRLIHGILIAACVVGIFALIAGTVATGGGLGIAVAAAWVISSLGMLIVDGYFLYKAYQSGSLEGKDKAFFMLGTAILVCSVSAGMIFSGGLAPLIISGVVGGIWTIYAACSYLKWRPKDSGESDPERTPLLDK